jgi:hypothetical protein
MEFVKHFDVAVDDLLARLNRFNNLKRSEATTIEHFLRSLQAAIPESAGDPDQLPEYATVQEATGNEWTSFDKDIDELYDEMIDKHEELSSIPVKSVVKPSGSWMAPLIIWLHYPPVRATKPFWSHTLDMKNPCITFIMAKLGLEHTVEDGVKAALWLERFYGRVEPKSVKRLDAEVGLPYGGQDVVDLHLEFSAELMDMSVAGIVVVVGANNVRGFIKEHKHDEDYRFVQLYESKLYGSFSHACIKYVGDVAVRMFLFAYHPEAHMHGLEESIRKSMDFIWNTAAMLTGSFKVDKTLFESSGGGTVTDWRKTIVNRGILTGCILLRAWEITNDTVLESAIEIPELQVHIQSLGDRWTALNPAVDSPEKPVSIVKLILSEFSSRYVAKAKLKGYPSLVKARMVQAANGHPNLVKGRMAQARMVNAANGYPNLVKGQMIQAANGFPNLVKARMVNAANGYPGLAKGRKTMMDRADLKYATMSPEDRQKRLKVRVRNRENRERRKALKARAKAEGVSVESSKPAQGVTRKAKSDALWSALPPKKLEMKLNDRARAGVQYELYKEKKVEADKAGITVKELTAHNPAPIPLGELAKRRADERYKDLPPEELAKKLAERQKRVERHVREKDLKDKAKTLGVPVASLKPPHSAARMAKSDAEWAALSEKEREQKLAARARSKKSRAAKKAGEVEAKLSEGKDGTAAADPAKPKAKKRKTDMSAEYGVDED